MAIFVIRRLQAGPGLGRGRIGGGRVNARIHRGDQGFLPGEALQLPDAEACQDRDADQGRDGGPDQRTPAAAQRGGSRHGSSNRPGAALFLYCEAIRRPFEGRSSPRHTPIVSGRKTTT